MDQKSCRVCLKECDTQQLQSIFSPVESKAEITTLNICDVLMTLANVQVEEGDGLPEHICTECTKEALNSYAFKSKCERSDRILRTAEKTTESAPLQRPEPVQNDENASPGEEVFNFIIKEDVETSLETCPFCCKPVEDIESHMRMHTKAFQCDVCNKRFSRKDLLLRHKIAHAIKLDREINIQSGANDVIVIKTEDTLYPCTDCAVIFNTQAELQAHNQAHLRDSGDFECKTCLKRFITLGHLRRHGKIHLVEKPYCCNECDKSFPRPEQLNHHMNYHLGIKPHICDICLKGFNQISNLKDHMRTHNGEKPFLCSQCGKGFNQLGNLRQHTVRHSGVKAHLCSTCGNGFASKGELSAHLRKHTGARPFVCTLCSHGFTTSSSLTKHKRIHSGEKPYECEVCKQRFSRSGILARHRRTHTGEKPYMCTFCAKAFAQSNDLTSHLRIHTGEKPYVCDACGQAFRQTSALKTHKKTHAAERHRGRGGGSDEGDTKKFMSLLGGANV